MTQEMGRGERKGGGKAGLAWASRARQRTIPGILARAGQDRVNMQGKHNRTSTGKGRVGVGVGVLYSNTTFIRETTPLLQIRQVAHLMEHHMQPARAPRAKEHTNNPVQKPNFRGHAVPAVSKFEPGQGTYLPSL